MSKRKTLQEKNYLKSSDICMISAICCFGYQVNEVVRDNPSKIIFVIEKDKNLFRTQNK